MLLNKFSRFWVAGGFVFMLLAPGIADSQIRPAAPTITVYQDPT